MVSSENQPAGPAHVAIIMDGNGRWAQARGLRREEGHRQGVEQVTKIVRAAKTHDLRHLTLYAFSVENWKRPRLEVEALMRLLEHFLREQEAELMRQQIRLRVLGRVDELPNRIAKKLRAVEAKTADFAQWSLNLALNYGSRTELLDAVNAYAEAHRAGTAPGPLQEWSDFSRYLYTHDIPDPDLVIRTSGEQRVSNFLLLQSAYAEYVFSPKCWPEFEPTDFAAALAEYQGRERRYGATSAQLASPPA